MRMIEAAKVPPLVRLLLMKHPYAEEIMEHMQFVIDQHTIDAVPVVRCKDCKHSVFGSKNCVTYCSMHQYNTVNERFFSEGKPKESKGK